MTSTGTPLASSVSAMSISLHPQGSSAAAACPRASALSAASAARRKVRFPAPAATHAAAACRHAPARGRAGHGERACHHCRQLTCSPNHPKGQRRSVRHHSATWQRKVIYIVVMFLYIFELLCSCIQACVCGCIMFSITRVKSSYTSYRFISYHKQMKIFWPCCIVRALDVSSLGCIKVSEALLALSRKQLPRFKF